MKDLLFKRIKNINFYTYLSTAIEKKEISTEYFLLWMRFNGTERHNDVIQSNASIP